MKFRTLSLLFMACFLLCRPLTAEEKIFLRLDLDTPEATQARHFRRRDGPFAPYSGKAPSRVGLDTLQASGIGQFSIESLKILQKQIGDRPFIDIDLRQESHGFFNDTPVSWYAQNDWANRGKDLRQVEVDEDQRLRQGLKAGQLTGYAIHEDPGGQLKLTPHPLVVRSTATEAEVTRQASLGYFRIPATDHLPPDDANVDRFIDFVRKLPADTWLHFHCEAGVGRTTTFLAMYDMLRNAKRVSFEDILRRQWLLGGLDMLKAPSDSTWKYRYTIERTAFLKRFYRYAKTASQVSWSEWKRSAPTPSD